MYKNEKLVLKNSWASIQFRSGCGYNIEIFASIWIGYMTEYQNKAIKSTSILFQLFIKFKIPERYYDVDIERKPCPSANVGQYQ